jgi:hypothetical protein
MKSVTHTREFEIPVSAAKLFPLFSPEGEKYWMPDWDYENVMGTTELSEDYVFLTKTHDHGTKDAIWIVKRYNPEEYFVEYYKIEPEEKIGVVTVECKELEPGRTQVQVTYKYMAFSASGENFVSEFDENTYDAFINEWQILLLNYFEDKG